MLKSEILGLFSTSYGQARAKFMKAAALRALPVTSFVLPLEGVDGETLATDVVFDGPLDAVSLLIVISGVHGVEGYCGSAIQTGLLSLGLSEHVRADGGVAVLHVHAANPYGFSHSRRVTQENVDLNRNFIDFSASLPVNVGYANIHGLLLPETWPPRPENEAELAAYTNCVGERGLQRAMSTGQYAFGDGLFFGGTEPTWSNRTFRHILRKFAAGREHIASIDIHTGLGPYGFGERIFACPENPVVLERARRWWGDLTSVVTGTSTSIPLTGPIQTALSEECPTALQTPICLEYGTYPKPQVQAALRAEHWLHRYGSADASQKASIKQALKDAFYPNAEDWKLPVWQQGREAYLQALNGLNSKLIPTVSEIA
jgi:hypothetical protein